MPPTSGSPSIKNERIDTVLTIIQHRKVASRARSCYRPKEPIGLRTISPPVVTTGVIVVADFDAVSARRGTRFLHRRRRWAGADTPRPGLILLDINLPKMSGHEVLRHVKADDALRTIPVVMLTTSDEPHEVAATYRAGANSFLTKPVKFQQFRDQMKELKEYWTVTNRLPPACVVAE